MSLEEILSNYDHFFFDLDGVVWEGEKLLPNAAGLLHHIESLSKSIYYFSNNTNHSRNSFFALFNRLGLPASLPNILCAAYNSALYLQSTIEPGSKVFVIGQTNLCDEVAAAGYQVISSVPMEKIKMTTTELGRLEVDPEVKAVVVGYSAWINFYILAYGVNCVNNGAVIVTSNYDPYDKFGKYYIPGAACTVEFLRYATKAGFVNVGKPEPWAINRIIDRDGLDRKRCVIFGDKMVTDILLGVKAQIGSVLVLTGVENKESYKKYDFQPDYVLNNLEF
jgi:phosphoglycolate/pyridoxal phosphate phosphatase family enzyme